MKRFLPVLGREVCVALLVLCAAGSCADFKQEEVEFCQRNPKVCAPDTSMPLVSDAAAGGSFTLVRRSDGSVWAFGRNTSGQLGDGTTTSRLTPKAVSGLNGVEHIAAGFDHGLALIGGTVWFWGRLPSGELQPLPGPVSSQTNITAIAGGNGYSLALHQSDGVRAWGNNKAIQTSSFPVDVQGLPNITAIAAGDSHALALDTGGGVWAWGDNSSGQLGNSSPSSTTPSKVADLPQIKSIAAGFHHSLAVDTTGRVWSWGGNDSGELGDGTTKGHSKPALVPNLLNVRSVAAGSTHSMAVNNDNNVMTWGSDSTGQLGDDRSLKNSTVPVETASLTTAQTLSAGQFHSVAVTSDGVLWTWGGDEDGQLGVGDPSTEAYIAIPTFVHFP